MEVWLFEEQRINNEFCGEVGEGQAVNRFPDLALEGRNQNFSAVVNWYLKLLHKKLYDSRLQTASALSNISRG